MVCSNPDDCAEIERRHSTGDGLLANGGASRGNLLSGDADHVLLTVSRISAEKQANPGYRAFFANGFNVTRLLVLVFWEVFLELTAATRQAKRDVLPRGHRGVKYAFIRAGVCVFVRDLTVHAVISDMFKGRPAVYATFASYDEVAHHSGLERGDTLEALRKLDQQFGRIDRARRYAPRPYEIVVLSDHGQTQGATFKQRHGYGLDDLIRRSIDATVANVGGEDENNSVVGAAVAEATGTTAPAAKAKSKNDVSGEEVVVLGSGNLGLVYLMDENRRMTLEEIEARPSEAPAGAPRAPARRLRARALASRARSRWGRAARTGSPTTASRATTRSRTSRRAPRSTSPRRRLHALPRPLREQLLRPRPRRGLRVRGADLVPRRHGRPADAAVHPLPEGAAAPRRADRRRGPRARAAEGLAAACSRTAAPRRRPSRCRPPTCRSSAEPASEPGEQLDQVADPLDRHVRRRIAGLELGVERVVALPREDGRRPARPRPL